ncbi:MAG: TolC family protein [Bacteroidota bacterium]
MRYAMNKIVLIFLFTLLPLAQLNAQEQIQLSLEQSIEYAQTNSPISRSARFALVAAKWRFRSFRADLLPTFSANGNVPNYSFNQRAVTLEDGIRFIDIRQSNADFDLTIDQNIAPTGGSVFVSSGLSRLGIFQNEDQYTWLSRPIELGIRQPLFQFNALKWRNRTEPLRYEIAKKQFVEDMEDVAISVTGAFFDVLIARNNVEINEFNVTVNDSIYNISKGRFQVGSIAENDLLESELAYRNSENALTTARLSFLRAQETFKALLGLDDATELEIITPMGAPELSIDFDKAYDLAITNNSQSLLFQLNEIQADQSYEQAKRNAGFSATLQASYGLNRTSEEFGNLYEDPTNRQFFTVGFQIPIFNWGQNLAEIRAARNQQRETANTIAYQKLLFELNVRGTVREFSQLGDQVEIARIADDIAVRRYDVAKNRYLIDKINVTDLFIAQREKDSARQGYIQALRTYWSGYYSLRRLTLYDFERDLPIVYLEDRR